VRKDLARAEKRCHAVGLLDGQEREEVEWLLKHLDLCHLQPKMNPIYSQF
jgi:hypothetical protein